MKRSDKNKTVQVDPCEDISNSMIYAAANGTPDHTMPDETRGVLAEGPDADKESSEFADEQVADTAQNGDNAPDEPAEESKPHKKKKITTKKIVLTAVFTALSYGLYLLGKFCKLPFAFPSFFDLQFSELPALIAGFALGPVWGAVVIVVKCLLKMPLSSTACVGEATDILLGLALVLPATIIYYKRRTLKGAIVGMVAGSAAMTLIAVVVNRWISIPFYVQFYFDGNINVLLSMLRPLFANINEANLYAYYLGLSVVPFNLLRSILMCLLTIAVYKRISRLIKKWFDA